MRLLKTEHTADASERRSKNNYVKGYCTLYSEVRSLSCFGNLPDFDNLCGGIVGSSAGDVVSSFFEFALECFIVDVCD